MKTIRRIFSVCFLSALLGATVLAQTSTQTGSAKPAATSKAQTSKAASQPAASGDLIDINSAGKDELMTLPGVGDATAAKIIAGRPYKNKTQLKSRSIVNDATYSKISDKIIAKQKK